MGLLRCGVQGIIARICLHPRYSWLAPSVVPVFVGGGWLGTSIGGLGWFSSSAPCYSFWVALEHCGRICASQKWSIPPPCSSLVLCRSHLLRFFSFIRPGTTTDFPGDDVTLGQRKTVQRKLLGCRLSELGWWSCLLQLIGTLLFNLSTYQALHPGPNWVSEDIWVWLPNFAGSILFLLSGYMAFAETCHEYWRYLPRNLSWWAVFWNLSGCIGFMISALLAVLVSNSDPVTRLQLSTWFTLLGAVGFFLGSMLLIPEAATEVEEHFLLNGPDHVR